MYYKYYLIATSILLIAPLIITLIPKYLFYVNIVAILLLVNGFINYSKYVFLVILIILLLRFIFLDKNKSKNKKGVVEYFDNESVSSEEGENEDFLDTDYEYMDETGIEEFLIKDKFSQLHDIIHEYQNALEKNKSIINNDKIKTEEK